MTTMTNEQRSAQEVAAFIADKPRDYFAYQCIDASEPGTDHVLAIGQNVTTWTGQPLARITWVGDPFYSSFTDRRQNFRCKGINGLTYSGTAYLTAGDYVRMRAMKDR